MAGDFGYLLQVNSSIQEEPKYEKDLISENSSTSDKEPKYEKDLISEKPATPEKMILVPFAQLMAIIDTIDEDVELQHNNFKSGKNMREIAYDEHLTLQYISTWLKELIEVSDSMKWIDIKRQLIDLSDVSSDVN
jgi:hypothetical protein